MLVRTEVVVNAVCRCIYIKMSMQCEFVPCTYSDCTGCADYELRLVGGTSDLQGRVELCMGNIWGTVCDDFWGTADAGVVCASLGYSREGTYVYEYSNVLAIQIYKTSMFGCSLQLDILLCFGPLGLYLHLQVV